MSGMRTGTDALSLEEVLTDFVITPIEMPMHMHMFGLMYAVSDDLTLMAMANVLDQEMSHLTRAGGRFTTESGGFGDLMLAGLYKLVDAKRQRLHLNFSVGVPTGSI